MNIINNKLVSVDPEIQKTIELEQDRQEKYIELIASENFVSPAVLEAQGSIMTNKYAEGYPAKRYYCGCHEVDKTENLAIKRVKELFNCSYANVQPHSGSQANQAVFLALLKPRDTILAMSLDSGGHLTHGVAANLSGRWFTPVFYSVDRKTHYIDYEEVERLALEHKPKLIIAGFSSYTRQLNFPRFREIADRVGAYLMTDIAHISGIIVAGEHPNPFPHAHVATSTTHKTLRGPRGGIIMSDDESIGKLLNKAVFPGLQGGPLMHVIAAKAVAFKEALTDEYKSYIKQTIINAQILGKILEDRGYDILTGGTENHIVVLDLRRYSITGKIASESLDRAGITSNKNTVPFDNVSPFVTSGIRLGTPACTTRGFKEKEFVIVGNLIADVLNGLKNFKNNTKIEQGVFNKALELTTKFPIYR